MPAKATRDFPATLFVQCTREGKDRWLDAWENVAEGALKDGDTVGIYTLTKVSKVRIEVI